MSHFLITSAISMAVLLGLYRLLFEREKMHRFNRFYLLGALVFSLALPFIVIEVPAGAAQGPEAIIEKLPVGQDSFSLPSAPKTDYLPYIILGIYSIVTVILLMRFAVNIYQLLRRAHRNEAVRHERASLILLNEPVLPHTFFNYIFINKTEYVKQNIEQELLTHEMVHVKQKHTLDIFFIEACITIFWFNPFLYLYKRAIQLNHEFLADDAVVNSSNVAGYQELLLLKARMGTSPPLASRLIFSITKKRFTMMTRLTSKKTAMLLKLSVLPVVAGLITLLCTKMVAQEKTVADPAPAKAGKYQEMANPEKVRDTFRDNSGNTVIADNIVPADEISFDQEDKIYDPAELRTKPEFPGGMAAFYKFISDNFNSPPDQDIAAKIYVSFVVEKNGSMSNIKVIRDPGLGMGQEAERVLKLITVKWKPGTGKNHKPVRASFNLPISINVKK